MKKGASDHFSLNSGKSVFPDSRY